LSSPTNSVCRPASLPAFLLCTMIISGFWSVATFHWPWNILCVPCQHWLHTPQVY
jgi:hypothetical protein